MLLQMANFHSFLWLSLPGRTRTCPAGRRREGKAGRGWPLPGLGEGSSESPPLLVEPGGEAGRGEGRGQGWGEGRGESVEHSLWSI